MLLPIERIKALQACDELDFRDKCGRWLRARIAEVKNDEEFSIMFIGWDPRHDEDCNYTKQPWRFAEAGSFSEQAESANKDVQINQKVNVNIRNFFDRSGETWVEGYVRKRDRGQVQVKFLFAPKSDKWHVRWFHLGTDDINVPLPAEFWSAPVAKVVAPCQESKTSHVEEMMGSDFDVLDTFDRSQLVDYVKSISDLDSEERQQLRSLLANANERIKERNACKLAFGFGKPRACSQIEMESASCEDVDDDKFISGYEALLIRVHQLTEMENPPYDRVEEILTKLAQEICEEDLGNGVGLLRLQSLINQKLVGIVPETGGYMVTPKGRTALEHIVDFMDESDEEMVESDKPSRRLSSQTFERKREKIELDNDDDMDDLLADFD